MELEITECPTWGSNGIKRMRCNFRDTWRGKAHVVFNPEFEECPDRSEHLFDHTVMQKVEVHSPAYAKRCAAEKKTATGC